MEYLYISWVVLLKLYRGSQSIVKHEGFSQDSSVYVFIHMDIFWNCICFLTILSITFCLMKRTTHLRTLGSMLFCLFIICFLQIVGRSCWYSLQNNVWKVLLVCWDLLYFMLKVHKCNRYLSNLDHLIFSFQLSIVDIMHSTVIWLVSVFNIGSFHTYNVVY